MARSPFEGGLKTLQRDLESCRAQFRNLIDLNVDGILVVCPEGLIQFANPAACALMGRRCEELQGSLFGVPILPGEITEIDVPLVDGGLRIAEMRVSEIEWEGQPACLASLRDITERHHLAEQLRSKAAQLADANRRKDEFLAMLSHELRNPLAPIVNSATFLGGLHLTEPAAERHVGVIRRQSEHLSRLLNDLLDVLRVTHGKVKLRQEVLDLRSDVIEPALELTGPAMNAANHELQVTLSQEPVQVRGDATRLQQVVGNLLNNAAKYTPEGGRIRVSVSRCGARAAVKIEDNGLGIDPDLLPNVFELFVQGDHSLDRTQAGLGVGLAMARSLVEQHGGEVSVRSEGRGKGCAFTVFLPILACDVVSAGQEPEPGPGDAGVGGSRNVLVVDDNRDAAETTADLLHSWGHEPHIAHTGEAALLLVEELRPEVLLLDLGLPGLNGYEVAERLSELGLREGLLLVALTGYGDGADRARTEAAGFDYHLIKPADPNELRRLLQYGAVRQPGQ